jgi:mycoredoxin
MKTKLSLYHLPYCGYCHKVRRAAARLGIELELRDISLEPDARSLLLENFGCATVPVLRIESEGETSLLPESLDIIEYLENLAESQSIAA